MVKKNIQNAKIKKKIDAIFDDYFVFFWQN